MQRSLKHLRDRGWQCAPVERWIPYPPDVQKKLGMPGIRVDVWGFGDILACRRFRPDGVALVEVWEIALFQTTDITSMAKHRTKMENLVELRRWKEAGGLAFLHAWGKKGPRGKRKTFVLTEIPL